MFVMVVIVFVLCWFLLYVRMFVMFVELDCYICGLLYEMDFFIFYFGYVNLVVNFYIYVIFNENYRRGFRIVLFWC